MMEIEKALDEIRQKWKGDYFLSLGIYQHIVECKQKFEMVKNHVVLSMSKEDLQFELDKELADLKILLDCYVKKEIIRERLNKFKENKK